MNQPLLCKQHKNESQFICLHQQCNQRLMCMLCEHNHEVFESIRQKSHVTLKQFYKKIDDSIDLSLKIVDDVEKGGIQKQKLLVTQYYESVKEDIINFLNLRMNENIAMFKSTSDSSLNFLIRARIEGNYHNLSPQLFSKIKQVYEGKDLESIAHQQQQNNLERAYSCMKQFHDECVEMFKRFKLQLKSVMPNIRIKNEDLSKKFEIQRYDEQLFKQQMQQKMKFVTNVDIQSVISDAVSGKKQVITIGFDKVLRVFDKELKIVHSKEYSNILTKIEPMGDNIYAIGVSKQLHINKISFQNGYEPKSILTLKGHTERICDISSYNSRILATCSDEGTKIWDLYKEKCEYTLRQQINPICLKFMFQAGMVAVGYHSHELKIYSITTMKPSRSYAFSGVPLCLSQENQSENLIYCGGFGSSLKLFDIRVAKQVFAYNFKSEAITTFKESVFDEQTMLIGQRGGKVRLFDLRKIETRLQWMAHAKINNMIKPNGVVRIFEENQKQIITVGSHDRKAVVWELIEKQSV